MRILDDDANTMLAYACDAMCASAADDLVQHDPIPHHKAHATDVLVALHRASRTHFLPLTRELRDVCYVSN
jgi:hypothetical protein